MIHAHRYKMIVEDYFFKTRPNLKEFTPTIRNVIFIKPNLIKVDFDYAAMYKDGRFFYSAAAWTFNDNVHSEADERLCMNVVARLIKK